VKLFSLEAFRAFFLKLMGCTYQEIGSLYDLSPRSIKYHVQVIKRSYPQAEKYFLENIVEVPQQMEEKVKLATNLAEDFIKQIKLPKEPEIKELSTQTTALPPAMEQTTNAAFTPSKTPTILLEAIDKSTSTFYQQTMDIEKDFEREDREKVKQEEEKGIFKLKEDFLFILALVALVFGMVMMTKKDTTPVVISQPQPQPQPQRRIIRLSTMGV